MWLQEIGKMNKRNILILLTYFRISSAITHTVENIKTLYKLLIKLEYIYGMCVVSQPLASASAQCPGPKLKKLVLHLPEIQKCWLEIKRKFKGIWVVILWGVSSLAPAF